MIAPLLLAIDFMNFTYATNPCAKNVPVPAVMRKGRFSYFDEKMGQGFDVNVHSVTEGSLAKGTQQAVVVLACGFPIGGTAEAYAFDERKNGAVLLAELAAANWGGDWGRGPDSIHIRFAKQFLYVDACQNDECTVNLVTTYALRGGKLVKVFAQRHKPRP
jgi:hypothetical protein